jgi:uncharacterized protein
MKQLFADTFYWIASINPGDNWHSKARESVKYFVSEVKS